MQSELRELLLWTVMMDVEIVLGAAVAMDQEQLLVAVAWIVVMFEVEDAEPVAAVAAAAAVQEQEYLLLEQG